MEVTGRRGRRSKQLLRDFSFKETKWYWKLKEGTLEGTVWRTCFGRMYGPVVRQTTEWANVCTNIYRYIWSHSYLVYRFTSDFTCLVYISKIKYKYMHSENLHLEYYTIEKRAIWTREDRSKRWIGGRGGGLCNELLNYLCASPNVIPVMKSRTVNT